MSRIEATGGIVGLASSTVLITGRQVAPAVPWPRTPSALVLAWSPWTSTPLARDGSGPSTAFKAALPVTRAQGYGRVINVISRHTEFNPVGLSGYSTSKAALW